MIKGISDFPLKIQGSEDMELFVEQHDTFVKNIPIIMNDIFDNYLEFVIKNRFDYVEKQTGK